MMVTLERKLSLSAPELRAVTERKALMTTRPAQIMMLDNGHSSSGCSSCNGSNSKGEDMVRKREVNTMETDDSSDMNQRQQLLVARINSMEYKSLNSKPGSESAATTCIAASGNSVNMDRKVTATKNKKVDHNKGMKNGLPTTIHLSRSLIRRQTRCINSILAIKLKTLFLFVNPLVIICLGIAVVQAGFWTFYFPNFLKPSGYSELTSMIRKVEADMNETRDAFADIQYFWGQMQEMDNVDESSIYPEESACADVFPLFRDLAIEYSYIDYEHFMKPMEGYHDILVEKRSEWFPEGPKSKTILPREWEQKLYENDLELKIFWLSKLAKNPEYRSKREQMVNMWRSVKRNLDSSLQCIYLRYSYRQVAEDINQIALDNNLAGMREAEDMVKAAYKRIDKYADSDYKAKKEIEEAIKKEERLHI